MNHTFHWIRYGANYELLRTIKHNGKTPLWMWNETKMFKCLKILMYYLKMLITLKPNQGALQPERIGSNDNIKIWLVFKLSDLISIVSLRRNKNIFNLIRKKCPNDHFFLTQHQTNMRNDLKKETVATGQVNKYQ